METADLTWKELPKSWIQIGLCFDCKFNYESEYEAAHHVLKKVFTNIHIEHPMQFLEDFCKISPDMALWRRFYWLSEQDLFDFMKEKNTTIEQLTVENETNSKKE